MLHTEQCQHSSLARKQLGQCGVRAPCTQEILVLSDKEEDIARRLGDPVEDIARTI